MDAGDSAARRTRQRATSERVADAIRRRSCTRDTAALGRVPADAFDPLSHPQLVADVGGRERGGPRSGASRIAVVQLRERRGRLLIGWLVDRFKLRWPLTVAYAGLAVALVALSAFRHAGADAGAERRRRLFRARRELRALRSRADVLQPRDTRHGIGRQHRGRARGIDRGPLLAGLLLGGGISASGVVAYLVPMAVVAGVGVFALSFCRRPY